MFNSFLVFFEVPICLLEFIHLNLPGLSTAGNGNEKVHLHLTLWLVVSHIPTGHLISCFIGHYEIVEEETIEERQLVG